MALLVVYDGRSVVWKDATADGDKLWVSKSVLKQNTGWELKPEGVCRGKVCVPIPAARAETYVGQDDRFDMAAFGKLIGKPVVHSDQGDVWVFGEAVADRQDATASTQAPDFELPDMGGHLHKLSDYRGKKVLLFAWASW